MQCLSLFSYPKLVFLVSAVYPPATDTVCYELQQLNLLISFLSSRSCNLFNNVSGVSLNWKTLTKVGLGDVWKVLGHNFDDVLEFVLYNVYRVFPGSKSGRSMTLTTHPLLVPRLRKISAIPPLTLWVLLGLLWVPFTFFYWNSMARTGDN
jgi:hypothetical protein